MPLSALASPVHVVYLTADSIPVSLMENWLFATGDDPAKASLNYNDSGWKKLTPYLPIIDDKDTERVQGVSWFRMHLVTDSSLTGVPLAFKMTQEGASEIFLDGKLVKRLGRIAGKHDSKRFDPQKHPFIITIPNAGPHVLAIRYVNYSAIHDYKAYGKTNAGFWLYVGPANATLESWLQQFTAQTFILTLLFGIFIALGVIHLLIYAYHHTDKSNLYFSIFNIGIAVCFFIGWFLTVSTTPGSKSLMAFSSMAIFCISFVALSGFTNELFSKSKLRFYLIAAFCLIVIITRFFSFSWSLLLMGILISVVAIEDIVLIIRAIYRRVKGARILGAGLLLFLLFLAYVIGTVLITDSFNVDENTMLGFIIELIMATSVISVPLSISAYLAWRFSAINKDLSTQLVQVQQLSQKNLDQEIEKQQLLETRQEELELEVAARTAEVREKHDALKIEKKKSDDLLLNILPAEVAEELKENGSSKARLYNDVSVLFTDFVNFTGVSEQLSPADLVAELDYCFREFDSIITKHGLEKIKTIGDAYLAVSGLPAADPRHAHNTLNASLEILDFINYRKGMYPASFAIRLGVHSGPVIAGIVGVKKFAYDIWGDTVNTAARMEQHGESGHINISGATYELVKDYFKCTYRGELEAKNKGKMGMYFVERI